MFFNSYYNPGPGVNENEAPKKGVALYIKLFFLDIWSFIGLNMIYFLLCLPVVTMGGATLAYSELICKTVNGEQVFAFSQFFESFKSNFKKGLLLGPYMLIVLFDLLILYTNAMAYMNSDMDTKAVVVWAAAVVIGIFITSFTMYFVFISSNLRSVSFLVKVRNAFLLVIAGKFRTLAAGLFNIAVFAAAAAWFPLSSTVLFVFGFYLVYFTNSCFLWPVIMKYAVEEEQTQEI